ncbi:winged helix-turn-helix domain-containing protein [Patescibacteria group bacterium]
MIDSTKEYRNKVAVRLFKIMKDKGVTLTNKEIYSLIAEDFQISEEDKKRRHKSGAYVYQNAAQFGLLGLKVMGLVSHIARGKWALSQKGKEKKSLDIDEYTKFQNKYWSKQISKKRKLGINRLTALEKKGLLSNKLSEDKKVKILSEILEQNKRILDYIMGEK